MKEAPYFQYTSLRGLFYRPWQSFVILLAFLFNSFGPIPTVLAQEYRLPAPGVMVRLSPPLDPPMLKGIKVHPDNPFRFDFILDKGDSELSNDQLKNESSKLIKYFLASLTIPEKDLWVNLSPYEKDRIIPQSFGLTEMGRDLLAEDYMLKQITASLIYPEDEVGKKFWKRVYQEAQKRYGTTNVPVNTFNKVWIVPDKAVVYENAKAGTAYVVESKLKVMLEQDYLSLAKHAGIQSERAQSKDTSQLGSQIVREIVIPELTKEVNENKNFAQLRQVYNSLILATWYKKKIRDSILEQVYANRNKTAGVRYISSIIPKSFNVIPVKAGIQNDVEGLYRAYLKAFKKGVYNYIKEDIDPVTQETVPRKYFSGGEDFAGNGTTLKGISELVTEATPGQALNAIEKLADDHAMLVTAGIETSMPISGEESAYYGGNTTPDDRTIMMLDRFEKARGNSKLQVAVLKSLAGRNLAIKERIPILMEIYRDYPGYRDLVIPALSHFDASSKEVIADIVGRIEEDMDKLSSFRSEINQLADIGEAAVPELIRLYGLFIAETESRSKEAQQRANAAGHSGWSYSRTRGNEEVLEALVKVGPHAVSAVPFLIGLLHNDKNDLQTEQLAVEVLGAIGPRASNASEYLEGQYYKALDRKQIKYAASIIEAMVKIGLTQDMVERLVQGLSKVIYRELPDDEKNILEDAFVRLGEIGLDALISELQSSPINHDTYNKVAFLAEVIGKIGGHEAIKVLIAELARKSEGGISAYQTVLERFFKEVKDLSPYRYRFIAILNESNSKVLGGYIAKQCLLRIRDQESIKALVNAFMNEIRVVTPKDLIDLGDAVVQPLIDAVNQKEKFVWNVLGVFESIGPAAKPAIPVLIDMIISKTQMNYDDVAPGLAKALISIDADEAVREAIAIIDDPQQNLTNRFRMIYLLGRMGEHAKAAIPALIRTARLRQTEEVPNANYTLSSTRVRTASFNTLAFIGTAAIGSLEDMVRQPISQEEFLLAVNALGTMGAKAESSIPFLLEIFHKSQSWQERVAIADALEKIDLGAFKKNVEINPKHELASVDVDMVQEKFFEWIVTLLPQDKINRSEEDLFSRLNALGLNDKEATGFLYKKKSTKLLALAVQMLEGGLPLTVVNDLFNLSAHQSGSAVVIDDWKLSEIVYVMQLQRDNFVFKLANHTGLPEFRIAKFIFIDMHKAFRGDKYIPRVNHLKGIIESNFLERFIKAGVSKEKAQEFLFFDLPLRENFTPQVYEAIMTMIELGIDFESVKLLWTKQLGVRINSQGRNLDLTAKEFLRVHGTLIDELVQLGIDRTKAQSFVCLELLLNSEKMFERDSTQILEFFKSGALSAQGIVSFFNIMAGRLRLGEADFKLVFESVRKGTEFLSEKRLLQYLDSSDDKRTLESMLLTDSHKSVFDLISPFVKSLDPKDQEGFIKNILMQISKDKSVDSNGEVSHRQLWQIIELIGNLEGTGDTWKEKILNNPINDPIFQELKEELITQGKWLTNWKQFQRLKVLVNLILHEKSLGHLGVYLTNAEAARKSGNKDEYEKNMRLYNYYRYLILHSAMRDFDALEKMILRPEEFLDLQDSNTTEAIHNAKKPSRLLHLDHIDLTARELVDGLILGSLNRFQALTPYSMDLTITPLDLDKQLRLLKGGALLKYLIDRKYVPENELRTALSNYLKKVLTTLTAQDEKTRRLRISIEEIDALLDKGHQPFIDLINRMNRFQFDITKLLGSGLKLTSYSYKIRIIPKSEPQAVMTGSEAPSCMSFGSGKNNIYIFNPNTAFLALSKRVMGEDGMERDRILATSVLTVDRKVPQSVPEVIKRMQAAAAKDGLEKLDMEELLPNLLNTISQEAYISADNVEAAPNTILNGEAGGSFEEVVKIAYQRFFEEYFKHNQATLRGRTFDMKKVLIGVNYSDFLKNLETEEDNHYYMQAPVAYTDKVTSKIKVLELQSQGPEENQKVLTGVLPLSYEDTLEVAYIENKAFKGKAFKNHLAGLEMELTAAAYNEALKGNRRKNLSVGYFKNGILQAYAIAFIGYDKETKREVIYISDLASYKHESKAGGAVIKALFENIRQTHKEIKDQYGIDLSVFMQTTMDDQGSYRLFMPMQGDSENILAKKTRRLAEAGLKIEQQKDLGDSRTQFVLNVADLAMKGLELTEENAENLKVDQAMMSRRQLFVSTAIAFGAGNLLAQNHNFDQNRGQAWVDLISQNDLPIKYQGKTDPTIYANGSTHKVRNILLISKHYHEVLYQELIKAVVNYENIYKQQELTKQEIVNLIGVDEIRKLSPDQDVSKMSFTTFMIKIFTKYLAQFNIVVLNSATHAPSDNLWFPCFYLYEIENIDRKDTNPDDLWGASQSVDRITIKDMLLDGQPSSPMDAQNVLAQSLYGNIFIRPKDISVEIKDKAKFGNDETVKSIKEMPDEQIILQSRDTQNESLALLHSVGKISDELAQRSDEINTAEDLEETLTHEEKHIIDGKKGSSISLEIDGHLAGMRKNVYGWSAEIIEFFYYISSDDGSATSKALAYILKRMVDYIQSHRSDFKMIEGNIFDSYSIKAQLYKIKDIKLRQKLLDAIYYQHQKEYGQEEEILAQSPQTADNDQKVFGLPKKIIGWSFAAIVGGGALVAWRYHRMKAIQQKSVVPSNLPRHERRRLQNQTKKAAKKKKPGSDSAMITTAPNKGGIDLTPANMNLQTQNAGEGIKFHLDPAMIAQLQNAPGFVPVIINIQPMTDLRAFLGLG